MVVESLEYLFGPEGIDGQTLRQCLEGMISVIDAKESMENRDTVVSDIDQQWTQRWRILREEQVHTSLRVCETPESGIDPYME